MTVVSFMFAWAISIGILGGLSRLRWVQEISLARCKEDWATCCGGNANNEAIISLQDDRTTPDLKKKLQCLLDPVFINNVWCSKWSAVSARYIFWIIQKRGNWTMVEIIGFEPLFAIEMTGAALVAIAEQHKQVN